MCLYSVLSVGDQAFSLSSARVWNVKSSPTLPVFNRHLTKHYLLTGAVILPQHSNGDIPVYCCYFCTVNCQAAYCSTVWVKKIPPPPEVMTFFHFFHKRLRIFNQFFTHPLYVPIFARLQIFIQLYPTLTKLCHIQRDCLVHVIYSKCPPSAETHVFRVQTFA